MTARDVWAVAYNTEHQSDSDWCIEELQHLFYKSVPNTNRFARRSLDFGIAFQVLNNHEAIAKAFDDQKLLENDELNLRYFEKNALCDAVKFQFAALSINNKIECVDFNSKYDVLSNKLNKAIIFPVKNDSKNQDAQSCTKDDKINWFVFFTDAKSTSTIRSALSKHQIRSEEIKNHIEHKVHSFVQHQRSAQAIIFTLTGFNKLSPQTQTTLLPILFRLLSLKRKGQFKRGCFAKGKDYEAHPSLLFYVIKSNSNPHEFKKKFNSMSESNFDPAIISEFERQLQEFEQSNEGRQYLLQFAAKSESDPESLNSSSMSGLETVSENSSSTSPSNTNSNNKNSGRKRPFSQISQV